MLAFCDVTFGGGRSDASPEIAAAGGVASFWLIGGAGGLPAGLEEPGTDGLASLGAATGGDLSLAALDTSAGAGVGVGHTSGRGVKGKRNVKGLTRNRLNLPVLGPSFPVDLLEGVACADPACCPCPCWTGGAVAVLGVGVAGYLNVVPGFLAPSPWSREAPLSLPLSAALAALNGCRPVGSPDCPPCPWPGPPATEKLAR